MHAKEQGMSNSAVHTTEASQNGSCLRLRFEHLTAVTTLPDLPPALDRWNSILSAFSLVTRGTPPAAGLLDVHGFAPLVIDLAVPANVLAPLQMGVNGILESLGELSALAAKIEELKQFHVRDEILRALEEQIRENRHEATAKAAEDIKQQYGCDEDTRNNVHKALMTVAKFIEDGGHIEVAAPPATSS